MHQVTFLLTLFVAVVHSLDIIGVAPSLPNNGQPQSTVTLLQGTFGNSWGHPQSASYNPPGGDFTNVQLELDLSSYGNQYDRLVHVYLNNVEIWRPSTPEPGSQNIQSNMTRDVSHYLQLFKQGGQVTVELDNVIDGTFTGPFDIKVTANFYNSPDAGKSEIQWFYQDPPNSIQALQSDRLETLPPNANVNIPKVSANTVRAGLMIYATGNSKEEFWYTNDPNDSGPTRLINVLINGQLAGIIDPFQPIFTGGMQPSSWYPIVGVQTFDAPSYYIDISTFLPTLWQSGASVEIQIVNGYNSNGIRDNWLLNTALFSWTDDSIQGTGGRVTHSQNSSDTPVYKHSDSPHGKVTYVSLYNTISLTTELDFNDGSSRSVTWMQSSIARNIQLIGGGSDPQLYLSYQEGTSLFSQDGDPIYSRGHEYPLGIYFGPKDAVAIDHSYIINNQGSGNVVSKVNNNIKTSWGTGGSDETEAIVSWSDNNGDHFRSAKAVNNQLQSDVTLPGGGDYAGSWKSSIQSLVSQANSDDLGGLANSLSSLAAQYAQGYGQPSGSFGAQALNG